MNRQEAFEAYKIAANKECPHAMSNLAEIYQCGDEILEAELEKLLQVYAPIVPEFLIFKKDEKTANEWEEKAFPLYHFMAVDGEPSAQMLLGALYRYGEGVSKNPQKAIEWYVLAAESGDPQGCYDASDIYYDLGEYTKAFELCLKAAKHELPDAQNRIGMCYLKNDRGTHKNEKLAFDYFSKAAQQGHRAATHNLGNLYYKGLGVKRDYKKAIEYFMKVNDACHTQYSLGECYFYGRGVEKN